ncbi:MAG: hypothetical protein Q8930_15150 [Bacillota bacterium]|nr:hypothetical protein [Bacillota bacterium]
MEKHFYFKLLPEDVKKVYRENCKILSRVFEYLEDKYNYEEIGDINFLLFYSFIEIECALTIYVDDVGSVLDRVRTRMDKVEKTPEVLSFLNELYRLELIEKRRKMRLQRLIDRDFDTLTLTEKNDVAYELADSRNKEHSALAAQYFLKLYNETGNLYYYCIHTNMLYKAGEKEKALREYAKILAFPTGKRLENRGHFVSAIFQDKLDYYQNDRVMFRRIWEEAKANKYIKEEKHFPMAHGAILQVAEVSFDYGFYDICEEMIELMKKEKLAIPARIKEHYKI